MYQRLRTPTSLLAAAAGRAWPRGTAWLRFAVMALRLVLALGGAASALAQDMAPATELLESTQRWIDASLGEVNSRDGNALRMEVTLGQLDSRLRLAPCARIEPYLPSNTRLWGKTRVGLRCLEGKARWNVFLPVTVKALGPAWVLRAPVAPGSTLRAQDAVQEEVDWASEAAPILALPAQWVGQLAAYPLSAGQPLRENMVRAPQVFQVGAQVRILARGTGFSVSSDGQALTNGVVGQTARVKTEGGRVVSGTVLDMHTVDVAL